MIALDADMPHAHLGLNRVRLVDDDDAARRVGRRERTSPAEPRARSQSPKTFFTPCERFLGGEVADDGEDGVVRNEVAAGETRRGRRA